MATESFLRDITIRKPSAKQRLANALNSVDKKRTRPVTMSRAVERLSRDKVRAFFGER